MSPKLRLYILVFLIMGLGIGLILYKHFALGFPLSPDDKKSVWTIEAKIDFIARGDPVIVSFALPRKRPMLSLWKKTSLHPVMGLVN